MRSRLRKQQRPGCACLRARGAAKLRPPALGGQPQFVGCYSAPAFFRDEDKLKKQKKFEMEVLDARLFFRAAR